MSAEHDAQARWAYVEYMSQGAEVPFGQIPLEQLLGWTAHTETGQLGAHQVLATGWLRIETAVTAAVLRVRGEALHAPVDTPQLLSAAKQRFNAVGSQQKHDRVIRSRAITAFGAVGLYDALIKAREGVGGSVPINSAWQSQLEAAKILLSACRQRGRDLPLHDLQVQAMLGLLHYGADATDIIGLPIPPRFQAEGDSRSYDILLWHLLDDGSQLLRARVGALEGAPSEGAALLPPSLLLNREYPSEVGQGTLQALLDTQQPRKARAAERHLDRALLGFVNQFVLQAYKGDALSLQVDPITGLEQARQWYASLSPIRRLSDADRPALEQCINPFENSLLTGDISPADTAILGWLRTELYQVSREVQELERAEDVFGAAIQAAQLKKDWIGYGEARAGQATARLFTNLHNGEDTHDAIATYCHDLAEAIDSLRQRLARSKAESAQASALDQMINRLTACLAISSDESGDYIAVCSSPRQRAQPTQMTGSDVQVIPLINDAYAIDTAGRLRLADVLASELADYGIAVFAPSLLRGLKTTTPPYFESADIAEAMRERMLRAVGPVLMLSHSD
jgi:hypothetical protein